MTVQNTPNFVDYVGDDATLVFNFTFRVDDVAWLSVDFTDDFDQFNLNLDQDASPGGNATYLVAPPSPGMGGPDPSFRVTRATPQSQLLAYTRYDAFDSLSHESALDRLTMQIQDTQTGFAVADTSLQALIDANTLLITTGLSPGHQHVLADIIDSGGMVLPDGINDGALLVWDLGNAQWESTLSLLTFIRSTGVLQLQDLALGSQLTLENNATHAQIAGVNLDGVRFNDMPIYFDGQAAAAPSTALLGQVWLRSDVPPILVYTDDTGADFDIGGLGVSGLGFGVTSDQTGSPPAVGEGFMVYANTGTVNPEQPAVKFNIGASTTTTWFAERGVSSGDGMYCRGSFASSSGKEMQFGNIENSVAEDIFLMRQPGEFLFENGFFITESGTVPKATNVGEGQVWVRNDAPNTLMFTDDDGTDFTIGGVLLGAALLAATNTFLAANTFTADTIQEGAQPKFRIQETGLGADLGNWLFRANGGNVGLYTATDAAPSTVVDPAWVAVRGTTTAVASVDFSADVNLLNGATLQLNEVGDVDQVTIQVEATTLAPATALVFTGNAGIEAYTFDEPINIDTGDLFVNTGGVNFYRVGDAVSHSIGPSGSDILMQVVAGAFRVQADSLMMNEVAAPATNVAGRGQFWVRSSAPNRPTFTDDTDIDQLLDPSISEIVSVVASRTTLITDKGRTIGFTGSTAAQTMTLAGAVAYQIGTLIGFDNNGSVSYSITTDGGDTLRFANDNTTGVRTLAAGGKAVAQLVTATEWKISGAGLT